MPDRYLESLVCPLPDDIARLIGAGEIDLALQLIERRLKEPLPEMLKTRLETERFLLPKRVKSYTLSHEELLAEMQKRIPDFTADELNGLLLNGLLLNRLLCRIGRRLIAVKICVAVLIVLIVHL